MFLPLIIITWGTGTLAETKTSADHRQTFMYFSWLCWPRIVWCHGDWWAPVLHSVKELNCVFENPKILKLTIFKFSYIAIISLMGVDKGIGDGKMPRPLFSCCGETLAKQKNNFKYCFLTFSDCQMSWDMQNYLKIQLQWDIN